MTRTFRDRIRQPSPALRRLVILACCAGAVGGLGCATLVATSAPNPKAYAHYNKPVLTDTIFALGRPDSALAKKIGHEGTIAFLGKQHTYLLVEGGKQLNDVAQAALDGNRLVLEGTDRRLFLKGDTLWGSVALRYAPEQDAPQRGVEVTALKSLGFKADNKGVYRMTIPVKGTVCPPAKLKTEVPDELRKSRDIAFFNPPDSSPPPDLGKLITVPLAVAVDVALTPVYVVGFVVLVLTLN